MAEPYVDDFGRGPLLDAEPKRWGLPGDKVIRTKPTSKQLLARLRRRPALLLRSPPTSLSTVASVLARSDSELKPEKGLALDWKSEEELCDPSISPFANYNKRVFAALRAYQQGERE